jgi:phospholipid/cholesterol/gamma-HCH transport system substrate-binding protein
MKIETKVGILSLAGVLAVVIFAYWVGVLQPFSESYTLKVMYNYAGGIEVGSPVRVMGIKVGKVTAIDFTPDYKSENSEQVQLQVTIGLSKSAWSTIKKDSRFYINLAGVIGEKFLEISPGTSESGDLTPGQHIRGEDPPRIDQLISQSYGLAGKMIELIEKNEGTVVNTIAQLDKLLTNFNKTLQLLDKTRQNKDVERLVNNAVVISDNLAYLTTQMRGKKAEETYELLHKLLWRLEPLDKDAIKKFFQEEGVRARIL